MKQVTLRKKSTDWKDIAAGWHLWKGITTCPSCGKEYPDTLGGTREQAENWENECIECEEN